MAWLLDTNAWIVYLKTPISPIRSRLQSLQPTDVVLCSVVKAELFHGAEKYGNRERRRRALDMLFAPFVSLPFDDAAARHYANIRHHLEVQGRVLGPNDLMIAAIALTHGLTLVSADLEFSRVSGLSLTDWTLG